MLVDLKIFFRSVVHLRERAPREFKGTGQG